MVNDNADELCLHKRYLLRIKQRIRKEIPGTISFAKTHGPTNKKVYHGECIARILAIGFKNKKLKARIDLMVVNGHYVVNA